MANLANIKSVWGESSRQYQESNNLAAEYLDSLSQNPLTTGAQRTGRGQIKSPGAPSREPVLGSGTFNLAFRPKSSDGTSSRV